MSNFLFYYFYYVLIILLWNQGMFQMSVKAIFQISSLWTTVKRLLSADPCRDIATQVSGYSFMRAKPDENSIQPKWKSETEVLNLLPALDNVISKARKQRYFGWLQKGESRFYILLYYPFMFITLEKSFVFEAIQE